MNLKNLSTFDAKPFEFRSGESTTNYLARADAAYKAIADKHDIIRFHVADGYAAYAVLSLSPLKLAHIPYGDAYQIPVAHLRGLTANDVREMIDRDKRFKALWAKKGPVTLDELKEANG